jgi:sulfite reductase (NADPH) flavoprotein alpha-component
MRSVASKRQATCRSGVLVAGFALAAALWWPHAAGMAWHDPGLERWIAAALMLSAWMLLAVAIWRGRSASMPRRPQAVADRAAQDTPTAPSSAPADARTMTPTQPAATTIRVVCASQTGFAEQLARQTLQSLQCAGVSARMDVLGELTLADLAAETLVLFVASTTGDGEPPDNAVAFFDAHMQRAADLRGLRYGLLALGDSDYDDFCGFGHKLQHWLEFSGAQAAFDPVEVDSEDEGALRRWQYHLAALTGAHDLPDWQAPRYQPWSLVERRLLNPGSVGDPCYLIRLRAAHGSGTWQAGDLAEIGPRHAAPVVAAWLEEHALDAAAVVTLQRERLSLADALSRSRLPGADEIAGLDANGVAAILQRLPHREYSIASVPADGTLDLLVRQTCAGDRPVGLGAAWLTVHAPLGAKIDLRVRANPNFRAPTDDRPLILVGNGTGMAAQHAVLETRIAARRHRNWLLFGERQRAHDFHYRDDIERWLASGQLARVDFAWSRDPPGRIHVQQRVREAAGQLRRWVDDGAVVMVCGSLAGMAPGVDDALRDVLGSDRVEQMRAAGRYRRDVY